MPDPSPDHVIDDVSRLTTGPGPDVTPSTAYPGPAAQVQGGDLDAGRRAPNRARPRGGVTIESSEPPRGSEDLLLGMHLSSTTTARHFVTGWAVRHHLREDVTDTLELLTSEVVGNAVVHGAGPIRVSIGSSPPSGGPGGEGVLVQVHDTSTSEPQVQALTPDGTGGRGLAMVELLAQQWGVGRPQGSWVGPGVATGKTVWFLLAP
jgi:anti-sigma regulatory factor (Ser/Thr protein kinase)